MAHFTLRLCQVRSSCIDSLTGHRSMLRCTLGFVFFTSFPPNRVFAYSQKNVDSQHRTLIALKLESLPVVENASRLFPGKVRSSGA
jgi:hypothetical protein